MFRRRKFPRVDEQWEVEYHAISADQFQHSPVASLALNISGGGLCFNAQEPLAEGAMLSLEMNSPEFESPIMALAKVVWCKSRRGDEGHEVGAEFWWVGWKNSDAQSTITEYLSTKATEEG